MNFVNMRNIVFFVCLVLIQVSIISAGSIRARITTEIGGKGASKLVNSQRSARMPTTTPKQDLQSESENRADETDVVMATTMSTKMPKNEEVLTMKHDTADDIETSSTAPNLNEDTTDIVDAMPMWDSTKIETPKTQSDSETVSDEEESMQKSKPAQSFVDRKKEAERLKKVVSAFHFNRVFGTTAPPSAFRAFPVTPAAATRQRALGFPLLITNTLDNFHHQLDWSRFGTFSAELE